jgi:hypothetical protein
MAHYDELNFDVLSTKDNYLLLFRNKLHSLTKSTRYQDDTLKVYWNCIHRGCGGSVRYDRDPQVDEDEGIMNIEFNDHAVECTTSVSDIAIAKARAEIMSQAELGVSLSTAYTETMNRYRLNDIGSYNLISPLLIQSKLQSAYSRKFRGNIPALPPAGHTDQLIIPQDSHFRRTIDNEEFLIFHESFPSVQGHNAPNDCTILGFASQAFFVAMCSANTIYADGTFSIVPRQFSQLLTIHIFRGNNRRLIPCLYALLTTKDMYS